MMNLTRLNNQSNSYDGVKKASLQTTYVDYVPDYVKTQKQFEITKDIMYKIIGTTQHVL